MRRFELYFYSSSKNRKRCLVINSGRLFDEVCTDSYLKLLYEFDVCDNLFFERDVDLIQSELVKYDLILFDHSGNHFFNKSLFSALLTINLRNKKILTLISFLEHARRRITLFHIDYNYFYLDTELSKFSSKKCFLFFKRIFDFILTILILPIVFPLLLVGVLMIKLTSKGPALFTQHRIGKDGKSFIIYKLRTMVFCPTGHEKHTVENDNRVFPVGRLLRLSKIDELPQLYNVLRGDMSLIGPRPEKVSIVNVLSEENPYYRMRHLIKPGITGWAQVNFPLATPDENLVKLEYDLYYLKHASFTLDLFILLKTFIIVFKRQSL